MITSLIQVFVHRLVGNINVVLDDTPSEAVCVFYCFSFYVCVFVCVCVCVCVFVGRCVCGRVGVGVLRGGV